MENPIDVLTEKPSNPWAAPCSAYLCNKEAENYFCNSKRYCLTHVRAILKLNSESVKVPSRDPSKFKLKLKRKISVF